MKMSSNQMFFSAFACMFTCGFFIGVLCFLLLTMLYTASDFMTGWMLHNYDDMNTNYFIGMIAILFFGLFVWESTFSFIDSLVKTLYDSGRKYFKDGLKERMLDGIKYIG